MQDCPIRDKNKPTAYPAEGEHIFPKGRPEYYTTLHLVLRLQLLRTWEYEVTPTLPLLLGPIEPVRL